MKKFLALVLTVVMAASLAACGNSGTKETQAPASGDSETAAESTAAESTGETAEKVGEGVDVKNLKVGFIFIGDENEGYKIHDQSCWQKRYCIPGLQGLQLHHNMSHLQECSI